MSVPLTPEHLDAIRAFLDAQSTLALATVNARGEPESAAVFFVSDDALHLYWLSSPTSRHSVNLVAQPRVAATIYAAIWHWRDIRGIQMEGHAAPVEDAARREAVLDRYRRKFEIRLEIEPQLAATTLYVLQPSWVRWLDNSVRFGFKAEGDSSGLRVED